MMSVWSIAGDAFHQTNHDAVSVASGIGGAFTAVSRYAGAFRNVSVSGAFDAAALDGGAEATMAVVGGTIVAAAPEVATAVAIGGGLAYAADYIDHFGQDAGWWGN